jgi:hypothetical protein
MERLGNFSCAAPHPADSSREIPTAVKMEPNLLRDIMSSSFRKNMKTPFNLQ